MPVNQFRLSSHRIHLRPMVAPLCLIAGLAVWSRGGEFVAAYAQVSISVDGVPLTQNFNSVASSGNSNILPTGWLLLETGANANDSYTANNGGSNSGNTFSYGVGATSERALGTLRSGNLIPTIGAVFVNDTGATITSLDVKYWGEEWRLGTASRQDRLDFQYSLDATSLNNGNWADVDSLDFATPVSNEAVGAKIGDSATYRAQRQATLGISVAPGATVWIRWTDFDASGADDGLAIDDFSLTAFAVDTPPYVVASYPSPGALDANSAAQFFVTFSEAVSVTSDWVELVCEVSGIHSLIGGGGPQTYSIDVVGTLASGESCELTVYSASVSDMDSPVDAMVEDFVIPFATLGAVGCGAPATPIHAIQGSGNSSPSAGNLAILCSRRSRGCRCRPNDFRRHLCFRRGRRGCCRRRRRRAS
jgi:Bacterial Ig-like domain